MTNTTNWVRVLGHNFRTLAKAAVGFYDGIRGLHMTTAAIALPTATPTPVRQDKGAVGFDDCADTLPDLLSQRRALVADLRSCGSDRLTRATIEAQIKMLDAEIAATNEPFCACGHRVSRCDRSRAGCLTGHVR